jgi:hypothetical protein
VKTPPNRIRGRRLALRAKALTILGIAIATVGTVGCGGHSSEAAPVALLPCAITGVGTPDSVWHRVRASGFTFCVPPDWRPNGHPHDSIDAKQWLGDGGSLTWDVGSPRSFIGRDVVLKVSGSVVRGTNPRPIPQESSVCSPRKNTPLAPDGGSLLVTEVECQRQWTITAWSARPQIYVQGEAYSERVAELLRRVMEAIRFTSSAR